MGRLLDRTSKLLRGAGWLASLSLAALSLAACVDQAKLGRQSAASSAAAAPAPNRRVAILVPLTGPNAELGRALLNAATLALAAPGSPPLDQQDTGGTSEGAAAAARKAIDAGAGLILGPLTGPETAAVTPVARAANIPVLAFTSDATLAQPGVWPLGITPAQQVRRLVLALQSDNRTRIAAVLPQNLFGDALANGLTAATTAAALPEARVLRAPGTAAGFNTALRTISDYAARHPDGAQAPATAPAALPVASADPTTPAAPAEIPPPPMDALFLGATGPLLRQVTPALAADDITPTQLRVLGPATWLREAAGMPALTGAWFAAPDPQSRKGFESQYATRFHTPPRDLASLAFDAAGIARAASNPNPAQPAFPLATLTRPEGFAGADGLVGLQSDGQVRRGLAVFEVDRAGTRVILPAPQSLAPGS